MMAGKTKSKGKSKNRKIIAQKKQDLNQHSPKQNLKLGIFLIALCTLFTASGQLFWRLGVMNGGFGILLLFTNPYLITGYILFASGALIFILALKQGELSLIYPFISLGFIWVALLSFVVLKESISLLQLFGLAVIIIGVSLVARGGRNG